MSGFRIADALVEARAAGVTRLDALLLLGHLLARSREWLLAHDDEWVDDAARTQWLAALARRVAGEPLAYLVGRREFFGLTLQVTPAVLVPRPETEGLVEWALQRLHDHPPGAAGVPSVVDLGTGSGAIALALKSRAGRGARLTGTDASLEALTVARRNAERLGLDIEWRHGDWWVPLAGRRFALAVSNPPYVAELDPHLHALRFEPLAALTPGGDGLQAISRIVTDAGAHLQGDGWLLLEHGHDQSAAVQQLLRAGGFVDIETRHDIAGLPRCTGGRWIGG